ncbi:hypothetical protein HOO65_020075 [Ceratocystis lukuohia]|uniref:Uncharacterized protein n=2 Tax=Ceratocystis TaxID=5157 RepID=A0A0F8D0Y9_CERFI|nr:hypothetical protein CFO_g1187 [Ceratocystis platani]
MTSFSTLFAAMLAVASTASAHMKITSPVPINAASLNNFPLAADGSDFPCKFGSNGYEYSSDSTENKYSVGSTNNHLAFMGSAVHAGGSCQVSLTYDRPPTKDSVWKVITSFEGGCPAKDQAGNFPVEDPNYIDPYTYNFTVPDGLEPGQYTLALTWFNKLGNREMYMNCALATLEGTGGDKSVYDSLPNMVVANIGNGCSTPPATDLQYPDPGLNLQLFNGATEAWGNLVGTCTAFTGPAVSSLPAGTAPSYPTQVAQDSTAPSYGVPTNAPGGAYAPSGDSQAAPTKYVPSGGLFLATSDVKVTATPTMTYYSPTPTPTSNVVSDSVYEAGTSCDYSQEGEWNCIGESSFQRCASGEWSAVTKLASGIVCTPGKSKDFVYKASGSGVKRALRIGAKMVGFSA